MRHFRVKCTEVEVEIEQEDMDQGVNYNPSMLEAVVTETEGEVALDGDTGAGDDGQQDEQPLRGLQEQDQERFSIYSQCLS